MQFSVTEKYPEIRPSHQRYSGQAVRWETTGDVIKAYFTFFLQTKGHSVMSDF